MKRDQVSQLDSVAHLVMIAAPESQGRRFKDPARGPKVAFSQLDLLIMCMYIRSIIHLHAETHNKVTFSRTTQHFTLCNAFKGDRSIS